MTGPGSFKKRRLSIDSASSSTLLSIDSKRFLMLPGAPSIDSRRFLMLLWRRQVTAGLDSFPKPWLSIDSASSSTLLSIDSKRFFMLARTLSIDSRRFLILLGVSSIDSRVLLEAHVVN